MPAPSTSSAAPWWSFHDVPEGEARRWRIGPLTLWAYRRRHEWRIAHRSSDDPVEATLEPATPVPSAEVPEAEPGITAVRYSFTRSPARIALTPRLADRPVIVHPAHPMTLPAGESALLYVSTPLWVAVTTEGPGHVLTELPCYRPSDTWFGPSTTHGELCYASRPTSRLELAELPLRPHRAVTPVHVLNRAREALPLQRLKVPVELLALFDTPRGAWTPTVTLERHEGDGENGFAELRIAAAPPPEAGRSRPLAPARTRSEGVLGLRAFSRLLGLGAPS